MVISIMPTPPFYVLTSKSNVVVTPLNNSTGTPLRIPVSLTTELPGNFIVTTNESGKVSVSYNNGDVVITYEGDGQAVVTVEFTPTNTAVAAQTSTINVKAVKPENPNDDPDLTITQEGSVVASLNLAAIGDNSQLVLSWDPNVATPTDTDVSWVSSNPSCVTVNTSGSLTAVSHGSSIITAYTEDAGDTATCTVTVGPVAASLLSFGAATESFSLGPGGTVVSDKVLGTSFSLVSDLTVNPSSAPVFWSSSNPAIASVDNLGNVTPYGHGLVKINVSNSNGTKTASKQLTFTPVVTPVVLALQSPKLSMAVGNQVYVPLTNNTVTNILISPVFYYYSSVWPLTNIISVDSTGLITASAPGEATVTVVSADGKKTVTLAVTVTVPVNALFIEEGETLTLSQGDVKALTLFIIPQDATPVPVTWTSATPSAVTVSTSGELTGIAPGSSVVTARSGTGQSAISKSIIVTCIVKQVIIDMDCISPQGYVSVVNGVKTLTMAPGLTYYIPSVTRQPSCGLVSWSGPDIGLLGRNLLKLTEVSPTEYGVILSVNAGAIANGTAYETTITATSAGTNEFDMMNIVIPVSKPVDAIMIDTANIPAKGSGADGIEQDNILNKPRLFMTAGNTYFIPVKLSALNDEYPTNHSVTWSVNFPAFVRVIPNNGKYPSCNISVIGDAPDLDMTTVRLTATTTEVIGNTQPFSVELNITINSS